MHSHLARKVPRPSPRQVLALLWLLAGLGLLSSPPARAHDVPASALMLDVGARAVGVEARLPLSELGLALDLPLTASPRPTVAAHAGELLGYVAGSLHLADAAGHALPCRLGAPHLERSANPNWTSNDWLIVTGTCDTPAGGSTERLVLTWTGIADRVMSHQTMVYLRRNLKLGLLGGNPRLLGVLDNATTHLTVTAAGGSWWQGFEHMFRLGLWHIAEGPDHLLFLLVLLLPAPLLAGTTRWGGPKGLRRSAWTILGVVTGFTLGHSVSLALAATGVVQVPARHVEMLIAVSILVSAAHAWRPLFPGREPWVASGFGLVHGLAFAEVLKGLSFDATSLALSLLGFNLGIEAMQLFVVGLTLPLVLLASFSPRYAYVRNTGAALAALAAAGWLAERALRLPNPLAPVVGWLAPPPPVAVIGLGVAAAACLPWLVREARRERGQVFMP